MSKTKDSKDQAPRDPEGVERVTPEPTQKVDALSGPIEVAAPPPKADASGPAKDAAPGEWPQHEIGLLSGELGDRYSVAFEKGISGDLVRISHADSPTMHLARLRKDSGYDLEIYAFLGPVEVESIQNAAKAAFKKVRFGTFSRR